MTTPTTRPERRSRLAWLVAFTFASTLLLFSPLELYLRNVTFTTGPLATVAYLAIITAIATVVLFVVLRVLPRPLRAVGMAILLTLTAVGWVQLRLGTLNATSGLFSELALTRGASPTPLQIGIWIGVAIAALAFLWLSLRFTRQIATFLVAIHALSLVAVLVDGEARLPFYNYAPTTVNANGLYAFAPSQPNVIVLVLDAMQSEVMLDLLKSEPAAEAKLGGFTLFEDTVSMYNSTQLAVPALLSGLYYEADETAAEFYRKAFRTEAFAGIAAEQAGFDFSFSSFMPFYVLDSEHPSFVDQIAAAFNRGVVAEPVILSNLVYISIYQHIPDALKPAAESLMLATGDLRSVLPEMNAGFAQNFADHINVTDDKPTFHFYHIGGAHRPYLGERDGALVQVPDTYANYREHAKSGVAAMMAMVDALQKAGAYDNTAIVVVGDHGVPDTNLPENAAPHLRPLIMVKPSADSASFAVSDAQVSLADVRPLLGAAFDGDGLTGQDVATQLAGDRERRVATFDSADFNVAFKTNALRRREYRVDGPANNPESWGFFAVTENGQTSERPTVTPALDTVLAAADFGSPGQDGVILRGAWQINEATGVWTNGGGAGVSIPDAALPKEDLVISLEREVRASSANPLRVEVSANGRPIGVLYYENSDVGRYLRFTVPAAYRDDDGMLDIALKIVPVNRDWSALRGDSSLFFLLHSVTITRTSVPADGVINFGAGSEADAARVGEWRGAEGTGAWIGSDAGIRFPLTAGTGRLQLATTASSYPEHRATHVQITLNGEPVREIVLPASESLPPAILLPPLAPDAQTVLVGFRCSYEDAALPVADVMDRCLFIKAASLVAAPAYALGTAVELLKGKTLPYLTGTWFDPNESGSWSGPQFGLDLPLAGPADDDLQLELEAAAPAGSPRTIGVSLGGQPVGTIDFAPSVPTVQAMTLPKALVAGKTALDIGFSCDAQDDAQCLYVSSATVKPTPPRDLSAAITITPIATASPFLQSGWYPREAQGTWSRSEASIYIPAAASSGDGPVLVRTQGQVTRDAQIHLAIAINGEPTKTFDVPPGGEVPDFTVTSAEAGKGLTIGLSCSAASGPPERCVFLQGITFAQAGPLTAGLDFTAAGMGPSLIVGPWRAAEATGTWAFSGGGFRDARGTVKGPMVLTFDGEIGTQAAGGIFQIWVNDTLVTSRVVSPGNTHLPSVSLDAAALSDSDVAIRFVCVGAAADENCAFLRSAKLAPAEVQASTASIAFGQDKAGADYLRGEWFQPEAIGTWGAGQSTVSIPLAEPAAPRRVAVVGVPESGRDLGLALAGVQPASSAKNPDGSTTWFFDVPAGRTEPTLDLAITCKGLSLETLPAERCLFLERIDLGAATGETSAPAAQ